MLRKATSAAGDGARRRGDRAGACRSPRCWRPPARCSTSSSGAWSPWSCSYRRSPSCRRCASGLCAAMIEARQRRRRRSRWPPAQTRRRAAQRGGDGTDLTQHERGESSMLSFISNLVGVKMDKAAQGRHRGAGALGPANQPARRSCARWSSISTISAARSRWRDRATTRRRRRPTRSRHCRTAHGRGRATARR